VKLKLNYCKNLAEGLNDDKNFRFSRGRATFKVEGTLFILRKLSLSLVFTIIAVGRILQPKKTSWKNLPV
jgi:hypothetical protein